MLIYRSLVEYIMRLSLSADERLFIYFFINIFSYNSDSMGHILNDENIKLK